jgi:hypothetical protein
VKQRIVRSRAELLAVLRDRRDELDVSHACLEGVIGLPAGYLSKVIAAKPIKGLSAQTFRDILDGLAMGVAAVVLVEDLEQAERMRPRWTKRKRPPTRGIRCVAASIQQSFIFDDSEGTTECRKTDQSFSVLMQNRPSV